MENEKLWRKNNIVAEISLVRKEIWDQIKEKMIAIIQ
jgi:hypothetical protein